MGRRLLLFFVIPSFAVGCATVTGLDKYVVGDCAGGECDGSVPVDGSLPDGDKPGVDGGSDSASADGGGSDATTTDAGPGKDAGDAGGGNDGGCGALDTPTNCTACGASCDVLHSDTPSCNGVTCTYPGCHSGWSDCNTTAPNLDGCECNTPGCCSNGCETTHSNGAGQNYYDCNALNTYDLSAGTEACTAYTGNQASCSGSSCAGPGSNLVVCGTTGGSCTCWDYSGTNSGHVYSSGSTACYCPTSSSATWN